MIGDSESWTKRSRDARSTDRPAERAGERRHRELSPQDWRWLRPYSWRLALMSVPGSYLLWMVVWWGLPTLVAAFDERGVSWRDVIIGIAFVSFVYALVCYLVIPLFWWVASAILNAVARRRGRRHVAATSDPANT